MTGNDADTGRDGSGESSVRRRRVLQGLGTAAVGAGALSGAASAWGKGISWVAFCGSNCTYTIDCVVVEDGEIVGVCYTASNCTVYYKSGPNIYRNTGGCIDQADNDPVVSTNNSDSRDPCGILAGTSGDKLEAGDLRGYAEC